MSTLDLYSDDFPHSTREGYAAGCRGAGCPGLVEQGMTCAQVYTRSNGDYGFAKKLDAGLSVRVILDAEKNAANPDEAWVSEVVTAAQEHKLVGVDADGEVCSCGVRSKHLVEHFGAVTVAATGEDQPAPVAVTKPKAEKKAKPEHGTAAGYGRGCRDGSQCPGDPETGRTCREAYLEYQRDYAERRKQNGGKPLAKDTAKPIAKPAPPKPAPAPAPVVVAETAAPEEPSALEAANAEIVRLRAELADLTAKLTVKSDGDHVAVVAEPDVKRAEVTLADGLTVTIAVTVGRAA